MVSEPMVSFHIGQEQLAVAVHGDGRVIRDLVS
jgi:hypothetical protein